MYEYTTTIKWKTIDTHALTTYKVCKNWASDLSYGDLRKCNDIYLSKQLRIS